MSNFQNSRSTFDYTINGRKGEKETKLRKKAWCLLLASLKEESLNQGLVCRQFTLEKNPKEQE